MEKCSSFDLLDKCFVIDSQDKTKCKVRVSDYVYCEPLSVFVDILCWLYRADNGCGPNLELYNKYVDGCVSYFRYLDVEPSIMRKIEDFVLRDYERCKYRFGVGRSSRSVCISRPPCVWISFDWYEMVLIYRFIQRCFIWLDFAMNDKREVLLKYFEEKIFLEMDNK